MSGTTVSSTPTSTRPAVRWRTVDIVVAAVVAAVFGVVYWAWGTFFPSATVFAFAPPAQGFAAAVFLMAGPLAALIVRRPGAALFGELAAALFEALVSVQWSATSILVYGLLEGLGAELGFLLLAYRRWGLGAAALSGLLSGIVMGVLDVTLYYSAASAGWRIAYLVAGAVGGVVLAGGLAWALVRALAATGVLAPFAAGRDQKLV